MNTSMEAQRPGIVDGDITAASLKPNAVLPDLSLAPAEPRQSDTIDSPETQTSDCLKPNIDTVFESPKESITVTNETPLSMDQDEVGIDVTGNVKLSLNHLCGITESLQHEEASMDVPKIGKDTTDKLKPTQQALDDDNNNRDVLTMNAERERLDQKPNALSREDESISTTRGIQNMAEDLKQRPAHTCDSETHKSDTEGAGSVKAAFQDLKPDTNDTEIEEQYFQTTMDLVAKADSNVQGENTPDSQLKASPKISLAVNGSVTGTQAHLEQEDTSLNIHAECHAQYLKPKTLPTSLNKPVSDHSEIKMVSTGLPRSEPRLAHWKLLIEKGIGVRKTTRKGDEDHAEQACYPSLRIEPTIDLAQVVTQQEHENSKQIDRAEKGHPGKESLQSINESIEIPQSASVNTKSENDKFHGSRQEGCTNTGQTGIVSKDESQKIKFVRFGQNAQPHSTYQKRRKNYKNKNACNASPEVSLSGEHIKDENPQAHDSFIDSTNHKAVEKPSTKNKPNRYKNQKRAVLGSRGISLNIETGKMIESRECVITNTATGDEKAASEFTRKPNKSSQPLHQTRSSTSSIQQSHIATGSENQKDSNADSLHQANQIMLALPRQSVNMSVDGNGRIGRGGARGRNLGRHNSNRQFPVEQERSEFKVEPKVVPRRLRGFQPPGSILSNLGASDRSAQESHHEKQQSTDQVIIGKAISNNSNSEAIIEKATNENNNNTSAKTSSDTKQPSKEAVIAMDPSQLKQPSSNVQSNAPIKKSSRGIDAAFSPQGIHDSGWASRSWLRQLDRNSRVDQTPIAGPISSMPNGNWDASDNTAQPGNIYSSSGYNIDLKKVPKYRFHGTPSGGSVGNAKASMNSTLDQQAPEKKATITSTASSQKSEHVQSLPRAKAETEESYIPPHLRITTPKVAIPEILVAVPKVPPVKLWLKHELTTKKDVTAPYPNNVPQNPLVEKNIDVPQASNNKGKAKAESSDSKLYVNDPQDDPNKAPSSVVLREIPHVGAPRPINDPNKALSSAVLPGIPHVGAPRLINDPNKASSSVVLPGIPHVGAPRAVNGRQGNQLRNPYPGFPHPLADYTEGFTPVPIEWDSRPSFNPGSRQQAKFINDWMAERVTEAVINPISLNTSDPAFGTGEAIAAGEVEFGKPIDSKEHVTFLPDDDFTHAKHHETADDAAKKLRFKVRQDQLETKAERKAYRLAVKLAEASYVPAPNPHVPLANIYLRPAEARDLRRITEIYNHYVANSVTVAEREAMDDRQWRARWEDAKEQHHAFIVAVQMSQKGGGYNRRTSDEVVAGFAYADDYGNNTNAYRYTAELQFYVANWVPRSGVGKTLVDRMLAALDPNYVCRNAVPFQGGENYIWYEQGGVRLIKKVIISIPYWVKDESALKWQKEWLAQFEFEQVAIMPGVGNKFGKELNVAILMKETGTMLPTGT